MLKQRLLTAAILIPIIIVILLYLPSTAFLILTTFIALAAAWEWTYLMQVERTMLRFVYLAFVLGLFVVSMFVSVYDLLLVSAIWWILATVLLFLYAAGVRRWCRQRWLLALIGIIVLVPCWIAINFIRNDGDGLYALIYLFILIWLADSAAYFIGKRFGTIKFAKTISPQKSLQGVLAALICTVIAALVASWVCNIAPEVWKWGVLLSLVTVGFSIIGDLFESMLKREANLKDSGALLPGHGGLLDRIDSLTAAAPIFVLGAILLGVYLG